MKIKLMENSFGKEELDAVVDCFKSEKYTQGDIVENFEREFAKWNNSKYAVMVNSGSSANLLMAFLLKEKYGLQDCDEVLVPSVTWPTTIYPIIQHNLVPIFCDVDDSFNMDLNSMGRVITDKTKAVFVTHLLGQPANLKDIIKFCDENNLFLMEDCCESLGAKFKGHKVGNFGAMGSFSFYFGHHMTTIEGGMITTQDLEVDDLLRSARSHGWVRGSARADKYPEYEDKNFLFDMLGYNLRSTNINAAMGLVQLKKLDKYIDIRRNNHKYFLDKIKPAGLGYQRVNLDETSSFAFALLFRNRGERNHVLKNLATKGIESRLVITGNLLRQPVFKKIHIKTDKTPMADKIDDCGLYIPNNHFIDKGKIDYMVDSIIELVESYRKK